MDALTRLIAIEDIKQLKARYFRCMDMKNWDEFRTLFDKNVIIDCTEAFTPLDYAGKPIEPGLEIVEPDKALYVVGIDAFMVEQLKNLTNVSTVHHGHMPEIELLSETTARGTWSMEDKLRWPSNAKSDMRLMHGYGHYRETYEKQARGWVIKTLKLTRVRIDSVKKGA